MSDDAMIVEVGDGRQLEVRSAGPANSEVLLFHHGTPGTATPYLPMVELATAKGLRAVSYSRPGYATSTRHNGRSVADAASDSAAVLDALGVSTFRTIGWSGGGPHALACAALLPDRCLSTVTIAGLVPYPADGIDWLDGMGPENIEEFGAALEGEEALTGSFAPALPMFQQIEGADVAASLGGLIEDVDRAELTGDFADYLAASFRDAVQIGTAGMVDDDLAFVRPWGFDLRDIRHLTIWQGGQDRMVPFAHGKWLSEHIPNSRARLLPEQGHLSIALGAFEAILDDLLDPPT